MTAEHLTQIEDYALAVQQDARFNRVSGLKWHFWLVSDDYNSQVETRIKNGPDAQRRLVQKGPNVQIGIKTWGEILEENIARMQFIQQKLEHNVDDCRALQFLQEKYKKFLEGIVFEDGDSVGDESEAQEPKIEKTT